MSMSDKEDNDLDVPEEFTAEQGMQLEEEIKKVQKENKARVIREGKERRRLWAQKITPRPSKKHVSQKDESEIDDQYESGSNTGMLPPDIVEQLLAREKIVFSSDSEDEKVESKARHWKKKPKTSGSLDSGPVQNLNEVKPPECLQSSLDFLKKKKMSIPRSSSILINSNQALRLVNSLGRGR